MKSFISSLGPDLSLNLVLRGLCLLSGVRIIQPDFWNIVRFCVT
jgi:hypothetical protein